jgi:ferrous iron transport protein A
LKTLLDLKLGQLATIASFNAESDLLNKLLGMGCLPGESIKVSKYAPLGCPIAIEVAGYELSLRKEEAACILIH